MTNQNKRFHAIRTWWGQAKKVRKQRRLARRRAKQEGYLAILGIMKNEALILQEWIDHYLWQGADKIVLIDNGSSDNSMDIAKANYRDGKVECISRLKQHNQVGHYRNAIRTFQLHKKYEWLLIADLDEFWFCKDGSLVKQALIEINDLYKYDDSSIPIIDVIYVNSTLFGSSGLAQQPTSVRESFVMRKPELDHHGNTKWVCRLPHPRHLKSNGIHKISRINSRRVISDNSIFQLNHYSIQSREYFEKVKMTRGDSNIPGFIRDWAYFAEQDANCSIEDRALANQVKALTP